MKKIIIILIAALTFVSLNCAMMPRMDSGYVSTKDNQRIEFRDARLYDDEKSIHIYEKHSTHTFMKRDLKEIHIEFSDKDYVFNH